MVPALEAKAVTQEQDEIDEIMREIKNLQESISDVQAREPAAPSLKVVPAVSGSDEPSLEEPMATMKADPEVRTLLDDDPTEGVNADTMSLTSEEEELAAAVGDFSEEAAEDGSLSMVLSGKMSLKLKYAFGGNEVTVRFSDNSLIVSLTDGTEMKIPLKHGGRSKS